MDVRKMQSIGDDRGIEGPDRGMEAGGAGEPRNDI